MPELYTEKYDFGGLHAPITPHPSPAPTLVTLIVNFTNIIISSVYSSAHGLSIGHASDDVT